MVLDTNILLESTQLFLEKFQGFSPHFSTKHSI